MREVLRIHCSAHRGLLSVVPGLALALPFGWIALRGFPGGEDWQLELARVAAYRHAWADGQVLPFWAPHLYGDYGSPIFLFYGHVFAALAATFQLVAQSYALGFLLALAAASALGVVVLQLAAASLLPAEADRAGARLAAVCFVLNPYLLADLLLRNAAAEYTALCAMPLALYGLWRREPAGALCLTLGLALVIATHMLSALTLAAMLAMLALWPGPERGARLRRLATATPLALASSAYAWLPTLTLKPLIRTSDLLEGKFAFRGQFQPVLSLFAGTTEYSAGPLPLVAAVAAAGYLWRTRRARAELGPLLALFALFCLLQMRLSAALWQRLPGLAYFQFPFRFMGPLALIAALMVGVIFERATHATTPRRRTLIEVACWLVCALLATPQLLRMHALDRADVGRLETMLEPGAMRQLRFTSTARDEYLPPAANWNAVARPAGEAPIPAASPGLRVAFQSDRPRAIALDVQAERAGGLCLARWSFPFWQVRVDGRPQPALTCDGGSLAVRVPAGRHRIEAELPTPAARRWGLAISAAGALGVLLSLARARRRSSAGRPANVNRLVETAAPPLDRG